MNYILPVATALVVVIVALVGGIVCITDPESLSFEDYQRNVAIAAGLLAIGRGLNSRTKDV